MPILSAELAEADRAIQIRPFTALFSLMSMNVSRYRPPRNARLITVPLNGSLWASLWALEEVLC